MANNISVGFVFTFIGDGVSTTVTIDLTKDPYFVFSPVLIDFVNQYDQIPMNYNVQPTFDLLRNLPTGIVLGTYPGHLDPGTFVAGDSNFTAASISGPVITLTLAAPITGLTQSVALLEF